MKAKHFSKIRNNMETYFVKETIHLFGNFNSWQNTIISSSEIMARTPEEAVKRYLKRNHIYFHPDKEFNQTTSEWGKWRVTPKNHPFDRFITYWK